MRCFLLLLAGAAGAALADAPPGPAAAAHREAANPPALYSFADLHRLTVAGAAPARSAGAGRSFPVSPLRLAAAQPQPAQAQPGLEPAFSVRPAAPSPWLLLLSGIALAGWVAHRRLTRAL